jgi:predicted exporter
MTLFSNRMKWIFALSLMLLGVWGAIGTDLRDDVLDLLPGQAVRTDIEVLQRLGLVNRVFISFEIEGEEPSNGTDLTNKLTQNAEMVGAALKESNMFREVVYRLEDGYEWYTYNQLWNYLPALSTPEDLEALSEKLDIYSIEKIISDDFVQLNNPAGIPLVNQVRRDPLGLITLLFKRLQGLKGEFSITINDGYFLSKDRTSCLIWAESISPLTDSFHAEKINKAINNILQQNSMQGIKVRIIGTLPHTLANANLVKNDLRRLLPLASLCLLAFLLFALKGVRSILVMTIPLMAAPIAIASLNLIYDRVSSIALGFGIVLLGIAVDFSIHLYLALTSGKTPTIGLNDITKPISLAAISTVGVFVVLLFSEVPSHRQMATLAIVGLIIALFFAFLLIPTIVPQKINNRLSDMQVNVELPFSTPRGASIKIILWLLLIALGCWSWPQLEYDGDLRSLDVPNKQIIKDEEVFRNTWRHNESQTLIVARGKSLEDALQKNDLVLNRLESLDIKGVQNLSPILPSIQTQKLNSANWSRFWEHNGEQAKINITSIGEEIGFTANAFAPFFEWLDQPEKLLQPEVLLDSPLRPILISMLRIPASNTLPEDNEVLVTTIVPDTETLFMSLNKVFENVKDVTIISNSKWRSQVEALMRHDIIRLSSAAGLLIVLLASLYFRNIRQTIAALAPVFSALSAMAIYGALTTKQLNMMHVLMGIMVIGLSVDYGIFVVCAKINRSNHLTSKAVSICAISTLIGFGVLALADHYALNTLGTTVLIGIGAAWPTAILISPVILGTSCGRRTKWT